MSERSTKPAPAGKPAAASEPAAAGKPAAASEPAVAGKPAAAGSSEPAGGADAEPIPRLPRGKGVAVSGLAITRILMVAVLLVAVLVLREPCARGVAEFLSRFEPDAGADAQATERGMDPARDRGMPGTLITGDMSDEERQRLIERELRRARQGGGDAADAAVGDAGPR